MTHGRMVKLLLLAILLTLGVLVGVHHSHKPGMCPRWHHGCTDKIVPSPYVPHSNTIPVNTAIPTVSGTATQGQTLTEAHGTWTNSPTSYSYQWEDCNTSGGACAAITSGSSCSSTLFTCTQTYVLQSSDVGYTIRVEEEATNASGTSAAAVSAATGTVQPNAAPVNTAVPTITGTAQKGQVLTENAGTWTNCQNGVCSYTYQWQRCSPTCANITGATSQTYTLQTADVGDTIDVIEKATSSAGNTSATSAQTATVTNPPSSVGTGASKAICTSNGQSNGTPAPCSAILTTNGGWDWGVQTVSGTVPTANINGTPFTFDDGTNYDSGAPAHNITSYMWIGIPPGLVTNDAADPVPLVITFPDGCTSTTYTRSQANTGCLDVCNLNTCKKTTDNGNQGWSQVCATAKCIVVSLFAWAGGGFQLPTFLPGSYLNTCGQSGGLPCDQIAEVVGAINYMESHFQIDKTMIFANGGSKGGTTANAVVCDPRTEPLLAGVTGMSIGGGSASGPSVTDIPPNNYFGNMKCPALVTGGGPLPSPTPNAHPLMWQGLWSASDVIGTCTSTETWDGVTNGSCMNGGLGGSGNWSDSYPDAATYIEGPAFGCTTSNPTVAHEGTVNSVGTQITTRTFTGCSSNTSNATTTQTIDYPSPLCHAWGCDGQQGGDTYVAQAAWNFWTTGTTTP